MKVGILALQGDFSLHKKSLDILGVTNIYVNKEKDLSNCDSLIIPGGESTTMSILIKNYDLYNPIKKYSLNHTIFGTCAGAILMSKTSNDSRVLNFSCINVKSKRNSWGRQIQSFTDTINLANDFEVNSLKTSFIRAPKFYDFGSDCTILGTYNNEPVLIRNNMHIISSFHPEVHNNNLPIYKYYLNMING